MASRRTTIRTSLALVGVVALTFGAASMAGAVEEPPEDLGVTDAVTTLGETDGLEEFFDTESDEATGDTPVEGEDSVISEEAEVPEPEDAATEGEPTSDIGDDDLALLKVDDTTHDSKKSDKHKKGDWDKKPGKKGDKHKGDKHKGGKDRHCDTDPPKSGDDMFLPASVGSWDGKHRDGKRHDRGEHWQKPCDTPRAPTIDVAVDQCLASTGTPAGEVMVMLSHLKKGTHYTVRIMLGDDEVSSKKFKADGSSAAFTMSVAGAADGYSATVMSKKSHKSASTMFDVDPCPPPMSDLSISGAGDECVAHGGVGTVLVTASGLRSDDVYNVTLWFDGLPVGMKFIEYPETDSVTLTFQVEAFGEYQAEIVGGIEFEPTMVVTTVASEWEPAPSASVFFTAGEACPEGPKPVVKPAEMPKPPMLVETGGEASDAFAKTAGLTLAGLLLVTLGGALMLRPGTGRERE